jgi:hypothetical protein
LQEALSQSDRKLRGEAPYRSLDELAETAYRIAALAATEFRKSGAELAGRATIAGSIIHSAIDAIASSLKNCFDSVVVGLGGVFGCG